MIFHPPWWRHHLLEQMNNANLASHMSKPTLQGLSAPSANFVKRLRRPVLSVVVEPCHQQTQFAYLVLCSAFDNSSPSGSVPVHRAFSVCSSILHINLFHVVQLTVNLFVRVSSSLNINVASRLQSTAKERVPVGRRSGNLRVLNLYWINQDGVYKYYEVILVDPNHKKVCSLVLVRNFFPKCYISDSP
jgi:hypothetical protein